MAVRLKASEARKLGLAPKLARKKLPKFNREAFDLMCVAHGIPLPAYEVAFWPGRKWRFDVAWVKDKVALEVQGGLFTRGRHTRGAALLKEHEKLNHAALAGFRVLFCTPEDVKKGAVFALLKKVVG